MNFALILFLLLAATGAIWLVDRLFLHAHRPKGSKDPWWVEYGASFFPVILVVFALRSFAVEPFKIPSGSMIPTLLIGDFILVNKYTYGIRLPILNTKILAVNEPRRGDVMVFRYPEDPSVDYIKRVVGLPGDKVSYQNKRLTINGQEIPVTADGEYLNKDRLYSTPRFKEMLGNAEHSILLESDAPNYVPHSLPYPFRDNCIYNSAGVTCDVPPGHYFVMGDNRDASSDSRVWGFVPDENIVGKAFLIWFNFSDPGRIGRFK